MEEGPTTDLFHFGHGLFGRFPLALKIGHDDVEAVLGQLEGYAPPDSPGRTGDDSYLVIAHLSFPNLVGSYL